MKTFFNKNETLIALGLIIIYLVTNSYCMNNFGLEDIRTLIVNFIGAAVFNIFGYLYLMNKQKHSFVEKIMIKRKEV